MALFMVLLYKSFEVCLHASFFGAFAFFGDLAFFGALVLRLLALDLVAFVAVVGGIGLAAGILDIMKDGSGKGCASIVLVCADCKRQV